MIQKVYKRGFTLIELLVVIAIIGILAGIVLASLGTARSGANDAAVKEQLSGLRTAVEIYYSAQSPLRYGPGNGTQAGLCTAAVGGSVMWTSTTGNIASLITDTSNKTTAGITCVTSTTAWAVAVTLPGGAFWCVDSTGASKGTQGSGTTGYTARTGAGTAALTDGTDTSCN